MSTPAQFYHGTVTSSGVKTKDMPGGRMAAIQTSEEITVAFWNPELGDYGDAETLSSPGNPFYCPHNRAKLVATGSDAKVVVSLLNPS